MEKRSICPGRIQSGTLLISSTQSEVLSLAKVKLKPFRMQLFLKQVSFSGEEFSNYKRLIISTVSLSLFTALQVFGTYGWPILQAVDENSVVIDGLIEALQPLQSPMQCLQFSLPKRLGKQSQKLIFCINPMTQFLAMLKISSSLRDRSALYMTSHSLLCSLMNRICRAVSPMFQVALRSPAINDPSLMGSNCPGEVLNFPLYKALKG